MDDPSGIRTRNRCESKNSFTMYLDSHRMCFFACGNDVLRTLPTLNVQTRNQHIFPLKRVRGLGSFCAIFQDKFLYSRRSAPVTRIHGQPQYALSPYRLKKRTSRLIVQASGAVLSFTCVCGLSYFVWESEAQSPSLEEEL